ncbi:MAG: hypothetical protein AB8G99_15135 [Planctomycetaceae bacterium]
MPLIGNKVIEKDLRDHLQKVGYYGRSAEFSRLELVAVKRPGWLQVFSFEVRAKQQEGDWVELFGTCRDDERTKQFDVLLTLESSERDERLAEFADGLITLQRNPKHWIQTVLLLAFVAAIMIAAAAGLMSKDVETNQQPEVDLAPAAKQ